MGGWSMGVWTSYAVKCAMEQESKLGTELIATATRVIKIEAFRQ